MIEQKPFGKTGLTVPRIIFGGGWVGGVLIRASEEVREQVLDDAFDAGIDWIDTAASYGDGVSEQVIGAWLARRPAERQPRLSTKFRIDVQGGDARDQMMRSVEASLERLGRDKVDVIYLHNTTVKDEAARTDGRALTVDEILRRKGIADAMDDLKVQGLCDLTGITALGEPAALNFVVAHKRVEAAQVYYNLLNPTAATSPAGTWNTDDFTGLLDGCQEAGMGTMGIRIFAAGHLASTERHGREIPITTNAEAAAEEARAKAVFERLNASFGTPAQTALRFGLACSGIHGIVVGIGEPDHLREALATVAQGPLPQDVCDDLAELRATHLAFTT